MGCSCKKKTTAPAVTVKVPVVTPTAQPKAGPTTTTDK